MKQFIIPCLIRGIEDDDFVYEKDNYKLKKKEPVLTGSFL
jgi:hypothetical protein